MAVKTKVIATIIDTAYLWYGGWGVSQSKFILLQKLSLECTELQDRSRKLRPLDVRKRDSQAGRLERSEPSRGRKA